MAFGDQEKAEESLAHVKTSLVKLEVLVSDILTLTQAKNQDEAAAEMSVQQVIEDAVQSFIHMDHFDRLDMQYDLQFKNIIKVKQSRFKLIIENLISNAIKYQDVKNPSPYIKISTQKTSKGFVLKVEDNGLGIAKDQQENMFKMFRRFHPKTSFGSGLGLYMVHKSAEILGGVVTYKGQEGYSCFTLKIPKSLIEE